MKRAETQITTAMLIMNGQVVFVARDYSPVSVMLTESSSYRTLDTQVHTSLPLKSLIINCTPPEQKIELNKFNHP